MKSKSFAVNMNSGGELIQHNLHVFTHEKFKPDNPFMWGPIPYFLMAVCIIIDVAFFKSLFVRISYDDPTMILLETAGLAFAADVVAAYAGILAKRISQGLCRDRFNLCLLLFVPILALVINGILRVATMSLSTVDGTIDAGTIALTVIAIVTPVFTSIGNFAISFQSYDPLAKKMKREEIAIDEMRDFCRRLEAIMEECEEFSEENLIKNDREHLLNAKKELVNDAIERIDHIEVKLMEYLGDPTSTNVLSKSKCEEVIKRLRNELEGLTEASLSGASEADSKKRVVSLSEAA